MKKIVSFVLCIITMLMMTVSVSAATTKSEEYWVNLSAKTGVPVEDLKVAYEELSEDKFNAAVRDFEKAMEYYDELPQNYSSSNSTRAPLSDAAWRSFRNSLIDGAILVTQDSETLGYYHGHAAIISGISNASATDPLDRIIYMTEHPGSAENNGLSWRVVLSNSTSNYWRNRINAAVMYLNGSTSTMSSAGATARSSVVLGKPYIALADKSSLSYYNCATLVYRCYINNGVDISVSTSSTVLPIHIVNDDNLKIYYRFGSSSWF